MIASHDGVQQLSGVAGNAIHLAREQWQREREWLVALLKLDRLKVDAGKAPSRLILAAWKWGDSTVHGLV